MKHKKLLITLISLFTVAVFFAIFFMIWFWGDKYPDFDSTVFREEVEIPGLNDGACPQGLAIGNAKLYNKNSEIEYVLDSEGKPTEQPKMQDYYLISAYFKNKPSRIYVTGKHSGYLGYVTLSYDGEPFYGHVGGIATDGTTVWLGSGKNVYCIKRFDKDHTVIEGLVLKCLEKGELDLNSETVASFEIDGNAAFVSYFKSTSSSNSYTYLYVGEFYRKGNYETAEHHHITLPDGTVNRAFMYEYNVTTSTSNVYGLSMISDDGNISKQVPEVKKIYSIPDKIQGVARVSGSDDSGDTFIFSQSYGLPNSEIMLYDVDIIEGVGNNVQYSSLNEEGLGFKYPDVTTLIAERPYYGSTSLRVYYVYGSSNSKTVDKEGNTIHPSFNRSYSIPSMSEGLAVSSTGRVNILFESSSHKYKTFVRQPLDKIYSFMPVKR